MKKLVNAYHKRIVSMFLAITLIAFNVHASDLIISEEMILDSDIIEEIEEIEESYFQADTQEDVFYEEIEEEIENIIQDEDIKEEYQEETDENINVKEMNDFEKSLSRLQINQEETEISKNDNQQISEYSISTISTSHSEACDGVHSDWSVFSTSTSLSGGSYYLTSDVIVTDITIAADTEISLCLNGYTIFGGNTQQYIIKNSGTLNLYDKSSGGGEIIGLGAGVYNYYDTGSNPVFNMYGGTITECSGYGSSSNGGGVYNPNKCIFNMYGGQITKNSAEHGGGVYNTGTFNMYGGEIDNNTATNSNSSGGGIYNAGGTFTFVDGSIYKNKANNGGGVFNNSGATIVLKNGSITENEATKWGGGIYNSSTSTFTITALDDNGNATNTVISENTAGTSGGGIYTTGALSIAGGPTITGNKNTSGINNNVILTSSTTSLVNVTSKLEDTAQISLGFASGVSADKIVVKGSSYTLTEDDSKAFIADTSDYGLKYLDGNITLFSGGYTVTFHMNNETTDIYQDASYSENSLITKPNDPTREGYVFENWYTEASCENLWDFSSGTVTSDLVLYAKWTEAEIVPDVEYEITFELDGGAFEDGISNPAIAINGIIENVSSYENPTKDNNYFEGWYDDSDFNDDDFEGSIVNLSKTFTENTKLYAKWEVIPEPADCNITFELNDGEFTTTVDNPVFAENGEIENYYDYEKPVKDGYDFGGWYKNEDFSGSAIDLSGSFGVDLTLYAKWIAITDCLCGTNHSGWSRIYSSTTELSEGNYYLSSDTIVAGILNIPKNTEVIICLNGKTLTGLSSYVIKNAGDLTIYDSKAGTGTIVAIERGIYNYNDSAYSYEAGTVHMYAGTITGGNIDSDGGGVYNTGSSSKFYMYGGEISGNTSSKYGGGIYNSGIFELHDGSISNNSSSSCGGGIYNSDGTFYMYGGTIDGNTSKYGGGVYNDSSEFSMTGGKISNNTATTNGGGVYNPANAVFFKMQSGLNDDDELTIPIISGNKSINGGGIFTTGKFEIGGNIIVTDNKNTNGVDNNISLTSSTISKVTVSSELTGNYKISLSFVSGVSLGKILVEGSEYNMTASDYKMFKADINDFNLEFSSGNNNITLSEIIETYSSIANINLNTQNNEEDEDEYNDAGNNATVYASSKYNKAGVDLDNAINDENTKTTNVAISMITSSTYATALNTEVSADSETGITTKTTTYSTGAKVVQTITADDEISAEITGIEEETSLVIQLDEMPTITTIAKIIYNDGTVEIIENSFVDENGLKIIISGNASIQIFDNVKEFLDIEENSWYEEAVMFATSRELFVGIEENMFAPNEEMSRAMIWQVLYNYKGSETVLNGENWYSNAQIWAIENGISDGENPDNPMTREQLVTLLYRMVTPVVINSEESEFADFEKVNDWAKEAMNWAVSSGIIFGSDGNLNPDSAATRAETSAILMRFMMLI